ncbi:MAG: LuxR C-terminal-related transcriptional regulator [Acidimicrobiales bacterium]
MSQTEAATTAVVVDRWPLVRLGLVRVLDSVGIKVVGEADESRRGVALARSRQAGVLLLGDATDEPIGALAELAGDPGRRVVALVSHINRDRLQTMLAVGVDAVAMRSIAGEALVDLLLRIQRGERAVGPGVAAVLVGLPQEPPLPFDAAGAGASGLTLREREVLRALASGASNAQIATQLYLAPATVKTHLANIYAKLEVRSRHQALSRAVTLGLLS